MKKSSKKNIHIFWGGILTLAGISVILRIPYAMPEIEQIQQFGKCANCLRFCFYFIGIFLVGGGLKKIFKHFKN